MPGGERCALLARTLRFLLLLLLLRLLLPAVLLCAVFPRQVCRGRDVLQHGLQPLIHLREHTDQAAGGKALAQITGRSPLTVPPLYQSDLYGRGKSQPMPYKTD